MRDHVQPPQAAAIFDFNGTLVTGEVWQAIESWMGGRGAWRRRKTQMIVRQLPVILASKVGLVSADFMVRRWMPAAWATVRGMDERELAALVQHAWETIFRPSMRERWPRWCGGTRPMAIAPRSCPPPTSRSWNRCAKRWGLTW